MTMHDHSHVTGDARKRLEAEQDISDKDALKRHLIGHPARCMCRECAEVYGPVQPFDTHPACRVPFGGAECGRRDVHTHWAPVMAEYPSSDPT